jgi:hypothetical protein
VIQRHQLLADGLVNGSEFLVVVEDIDFPNLSPIESRLAFEENPTRGVMALTEVGTVSRSTGAAAASANSA